MKIPNFQLSHLGPSEDTKAGGGRGEEDGACESSTRKIPNQLLEGNIIEEL